MTRDDDHVHSYRKDCTGKSRGLLLANSRNLCFLGGSQKVDDSGDTNKQLAHANQEPSFFCVCVCVFYLIICDQEIVTERVGKFRTDRIHINSSQNNLTARTRGSKLLRSKVMKVVNQMLMKGVRKTYTL
jgi:hypothetical protein